MKSNGTIFVIFCVSALALTLVAGMTACNKELGVRDVSPATGVLGGGEPVTVNGSGFSPSMGFTVYFGSVKASNITVSGTNTLTVTTPPASKEKVVDVRVATDNGTTFVIKNGFRYISKGTLDIRELGARKSMRDQ